MTFGVVSYPVLSAEFDADLVSRFLAKPDGHREVLRQVYKSAMTGRPNHPRSRQDGAQ